MKIAGNITELIGKTPMVKLNRIAGETGANIFVKLESQNPGGSVKDRLAFAMIDVAEKQGLVNIDTVIIEPTSGNTGIGLAMVCAVKGYRLIIVMPESVSVERRILLKAYGAELVLTSASGGMKEAIARAEEIAAENSRSFVPMQFENPANAEMHRKTTALEIWNDTDGTVDVFVAGAGTGGTITGTARYLRSQNPNVRVIAVDPVGSPVKFMFDYWKEHGQDPPQAEIAKRDGSYKVEGIGMDHHTKNLDFTLLTEVVSIPDEAAFANALNFIDLSGRDVGGSSGAALAAMRQLAPSLGILDVAVVILPDLGNQYLERFMNQEWMKQNGFVGEGQELSIADLVRRKNVPGIVSVSLDDTVERAMYLMEENKFGQLPVTREGDLTYASVTLEGLRNLDLSPLGKRLKLREVVHLDRDVPGYKPFPVLPETGASRKDLEDALFTHPAVLIRDENGQITSLLTIADQLELI